MSHKMTMHCQGDKEGTYWTDLPTHFIINKLYNTVYGYVSRKVPTHMPHMHMINKDIMQQLQDALLA